MHFSPKINQYSFSNIVISASIISQDLIVFPFLIYNKHIKDWNSPVDCFLKKEAALMTSYKKKYQWLLFVIYAGIFTRSIIFRILNTLIHPSMFLSSGGINTPDTRFFWLQISDTIFSVCSSVFLSVAFSYYIFL